MEQALLDILAAERPGDGVTTEERASTCSSAGRRWLLDPIDGTLSYLAGGRHWGTHVALEVEGCVVVAVLTRPTEKRRWWAVRGGGAYVSTADWPATSQRLTLSNTRSLECARVGGLVYPGSRAAAAIAARATWVDDDVSIVGALLEGRVDAVLDEGGDPWDRAPAALLVVEAGGRFRDARGGSRLDLPWALYTNAHLCRELSELLDRLSA